MPYFCRNPLILTDFYAIQTPIVWHLLGAYFLQIWGVGVVRIIFRKDQKNPRAHKNKIGTLPPPPPKPKIPSDTKLLLTKNDFEIIIFEKLRISRVISGKSLSFLEILRVQIPSKITKNNSQGIIFAIILCQRVPPPPLKRGIFWTWVFPAERTHFFRASIKLVHPFPAPELRTRNLRTRGFFSEKKLRITLRANGALISEPRFSTPCEMRFFPREKGKTAFSKKNPRQRPFSLSRMGKSHLAGGRKSGLTN